MIRVREVRCELEKDLLTSIASKLKIRKDNIINFNIIKESIDSRRKPNIFLIYEVDVKLKDESIIYDRLGNDIEISKNEVYNYTPKGNIKIKRPIIIGAGPAGLFAAYSLAINNYKPIVIERGKCVDDRINDVEKFLKTGILDTNSNVQFGEGGAGTFSDGKLNTMVKDVGYRNKFVLETFVKYGAYSDILYKAKPHIGTDKLINVIKNMRNDIIRLGGEFKYSETLTDIVIKNNRIESIITNKNTYDTDILILAIGHSARDTFYMLNNYLNMEAKPFAIGVRIMHNQDMIDVSQYGKVYKSLGPASYKLTYQTKKGRGVYTFCMCPGGYVINASSENSMLAINGMSNHDRSSRVANSALIVTVTPNDFGNNPLDGVEYQRDLERKAYNLANGSIPIQLYKDFKENKESINYKSVIPTLKGSFKLTDINRILPNYISESLKEAIPYFGTKIKGFDNDDAILAAIESRTSSPLRIVRNDEFVSNIDGIYPIGEGAGYAGGITSAAVDGVKVSESIMDKYTL